MATGIFSEISNLLNSAGLLGFMAQVREAPMRVDTEDPWALTELAKGEGGWGNTPI